jgi:enoyl-CoA hydratase/carnithine racemase
VDNLTIERADGVATLTIDRPHRKNAIDVPTWDELQAALDELAVDEGVRCVVLTGAGGDFCAGADLSGGGDGGEVHQLERMRRIGKVVIALRDLPQPTIAKVRGVAVGVGMSLALGCDLVLAADDARFSLIFARRGLSLDGGASWLVPRLIGMHKAKELALFADIIAAADALELGLLNRVVPGDDLDGLTASWAARLVSGPPIALGMTKRMLNRAYDVGFEQAIDDESRCQTVNFATQDTVEAMRAFLEKRDPVFEGR